MEVEDCKREFMLHSEIFIRILQRFRDHRAFHISSIYKEILKVAVSSCDDRFSKITCDPQAGLFIIDLKQICRNIPSVQIVNDIF